MGTKGIFRILLLAISSALFVGCSSNGSTTASVWEETKTIGRHLQRKSQTLWGTQTDSKLVRSSDEFIGPVEEEFLPLSSEDLQTAVVSNSPDAERTVKTTKSAGAPPTSIDLFREPTSNLASIFQRVHFNTDEHVLRKKEYFQTVSKIAEYMKDHGDVYIYVLGHCDQRASESYNLALGTRRANAVKSLLIQRGVPSNRIYTLSMGKEMPLDPHNDAGSWAKNRRVEFKLYTK